MIKNNWKTIVIDFFIKHVKFRTILICIFPMWFSFGNSYLGNCLELKDNGELTIEGWILNSVLLIIYVVFNVIIGFIPKRNEELAQQKENDLKAFKDTVAVNNQLIDITSELCSRKLTKITQNIDLFSVGGILAFCPIDHLQEISLNIRNCVSYITGIPNRKIIVSILYRLKESDNWEWVNQSNLNSDTRFNPKKLVDDPNSTFHYVLSNQTLVVFNDKMLANEENHYIFDDNDNSHGKKGSIACQKTTISVEKEKITALLSISTYGYRFVDDMNLDNRIKDTQMFEKNLRDKILPQFSDRISLELLTLYLQTYKKTCDNKLINFQF